ncbi:MAG: alpha-L-rhamnosidase N-terminal domain-containing protein, partial [Planctomycetota bacterium]
MFKAVTLSLWLSIFLLSISFAAEPATDLTVGEGFTNPIGFHDPTPTFSWKLPAGVEKQTAYQITLARGLERWDSGWIESEQSVRVPWTGQPFESREGGCWKVRYRDQDGNESDWSDFARFTMGLQSKDDWQAKWIRPKESSDPKQEPVAWLRKKFTVDAAGHGSAHLYVTARGMFDVKLNGIRVSDDYFANGWTSYNNRIDTLTYKVHRLIKQGENTIEVALGKGWYGGRLVAKGNYAVYGADPEALVQLEIALPEGKKQVVVSDETWEGTWTGPIKSSSIYDGEHYDATQPITDWQPVV